MKSRSLSAMRQLPAQGVDASKLSRADGAAAGPAGRGVPGVCCLMPGVRCPAPPPRSHPGDAPGARGPCGGRERRLQVGLVRLLPPETPPQRYLRGSLESSREDGCGAALPAIRHLPPTQPDHCALRNSARTQRTG